MSLLTIENLAVEFRTDEGVLRAVDGISLSIEPGETLGIVGESGSGKSVTSLAILGLVPRPPGKIVGGKALFQGHDLLAMSQGELAKIRGNRIAMIFQDPMTSLNPFLTIGQQLTEVTRLDDYPHQFSGGMRQRVMIAMALACKPALLIADEPTTALDVTIQAQILELMKDLQQAEGTAIILITHDLGVVANICRRVNVMYAGRFVEEAAVGDLFSRPRHPYTLGLLQSIPRLDAAKEALTPIRGQPPDMIHPPTGCRFNPRCPNIIDRCPKEVPPLFTAENGQRFACFNEVREPEFRIQNPEARSFA
jgi:oligopeptide transport system ATP-binding protein